MQEIKTKKEPIIIHVSDEELKVLKARLAKCIREDNEEELDEIGKIYPVRAEYLDMVKTFHGINYVIDSEYNVYCAIEKYGMQWLEK